MVSSLILFISGAGSQIIDHNDSLLTSNPNFINSSIGVVLIFLLNLFWIDIDSHHEDSF